MNYRFHPQELTEFRAAVRHYESKERGLGRRFAGCVESAIDSICTAPSRWPVLEEPIRRRLVRIFPYAVLYAEMPDHVPILAVMHCHQRPGYWRGRM